MAASQTGIVDGIERADLPTGARYLKIRHFADPAKDSAWLERIKREMSDTPDDFRREILMDETVHGGQPVYSNYVDDRHCPPKFRTQAIPTVNGSIYFGGWDAGQTLTPAFVLLQVTLPLFQVHALLEVTSGGGESMEVFAPRVNAAIRDRLPGEWASVRHHGDQTIGQRSGSRGETAKSVARKHGIEIALVSNTWAPRMAAVEWLLSREVDGITGFIVDGQCSLLRKGFQGAYKLRSSASGDSAGPGAVLLAPDKNLYSHVHDALQYPAVAIRQMVEGTGTKMHR